MKQTISKLTLLVGALTATAASTVWATFWWRWVAREYGVAPTGSQNLEHAIVNEVGGTAIAGFVVFWTFCRIVGVLRKEAPPSVSPMDVIRYLAPTLPTVNPTSNQAIAYHLIRSALKRFMINTAYRLGRLVRSIWPRR